MSSKFNQYDFRTTTKKKLKLFECKSLIFTLKYQIVLQFKIKMLVKTIYGIELNFFFLIFVSKTYIERCIVFSKSMYEY